MPLAGKGMLLTSMDIDPSDEARLTDQTALKPQVISHGVYRLMWDLAKSDIPGH